MLTCPVMMLQFVVLNSVTLGPQIQFTLKTKAILKLQEYLNLRSILGPKSSF